MSRFPLPGLGRPVGLPGPKGAGIGAVQNNGSAVTARQTINFAGSPLKAVDNAGAGRTDVSVIKEGPLNAAWPEYGVKADNSTDDTAAWQAAINALPQSNTTGFGGTILHPGGRSLVAGTLSANTNPAFGGLKIQGPSHKGSVFSHGRAQIVFTGTTGVGANGAMFDLRSAYDFELRNVSFQYSNAGYAGNLLDFSHGTAGADGGTGVIEGCNFSGDTTLINGAASLVLLDHAIVVTIRDSRFEYAQRGVRGNITASYSNAINILQSYFANIAVAGCTDADETWVIDGCTFETNMVCYSQDTAGGAFNGLTFSNNWIGDRTSGTMILLPAAAGTCNGLTCFGNNFEGSGHALDASGGLHTAFIAGNRLSADASHGIQLPAGAPGSTGLTIVGNQWTGGGSVFNLGNGFNWSAMTVLGNQGCANDGYISPSGGVKFGINSGSGIGFYGTTPISQAARAGQLTDSTGGTVSATLAAGITDAVAKNAVASLAAKVNALETIVHNLGLSA